MLNAHIRSEGGSAQRLRLAFYGDDFTGSTDSLEALVSSGVRAVLFVDPPTPAELASRFPDVEAIGIAGDSRAMSPEEMRSALPDTFARIANLRPEVVHYKVCSTYDSSPQVGNIVVAGKILCDAFDASTAWALGGAPHLGRYLAFGHLFARYGGDGRVYRIDRHPVMQRHPTTPMNESELRLHLERQGSHFAVDNVTREELSDPDALDLRVVGREPPGEGPVRLTLFDAVAPDDVRPFAEAVQRRVDAGDRPVVIGPSSVEDALPRAWRRGERGVASPARPIAPVGRVLVLSGSCSPMTDLQIDRALEAGYALVNVEPAEIGTDDHDRALDEKVSASLDSAGAVIVATCRSGSGSGDRVPPDRVGALFARLLTSAVETSGVRRAVIAGGDTSSRTLRRLPVTALDMTHRLAPGVPLCRMHAAESRFDGMEIALKGGQLGDRDLFERAWRGGRGL